MEMASQSGWEEPPVVKTLLKHPQKFDFIQAARILEARSILLHEYDNQHTSPGTNGPVTHEPFKAIHNTSFQFTPADIVKLTIPKDADDQPLQPEMMISFLGLLGQSGALPRHYTEHANNRRGIHKDPTFVAFCDLFLHRAAGLYIRSFLKYHLPVKVEFDRLNADPSELDEFSELLLSFLGLGTPGLTKDMALSPDTLIYYSGHLSHQNCHLANLEAILADYFKIMVDIIQFIGHWIDIPVASQCSMDKHSPAPALGVNLVSGSRIWDQNSKFRIRLGPLNYQKFTSFLPGADWLKQLKELVLTSAGMDFDFEVQLILSREYVPRLQLDSSNETTAPRLGYDSWIKSSPFRNDVDDVILSYHTICAN